MPVAALRETLVEMELEILLPITALQPLPEPEWGDSTHVLRAVRCSLLFNLNTRGTIARTSGAARGSARY